MLITYFLLNLNTLMLYTRSELADVDRDRADGRLPRSSGLLVKSTRWCSSRCHMNGTNV